MILYLFVVVVFSQRGRTPGELVGDRVAKISLPLDLLMGPSPSSPPFPTHFPSGSEVTMCDGGGVGDNSATQVLLLPT